MDRISRAMQQLAGSGSEHDQGALIPFQKLLDLMVSRPEIVIRNVFQLFHDLISSHLGSGLDEYPDDPESIGFVFYDCARLFVEGSDHPFFADRLFANRLMRHVEAFRRGSQQNKILIFKGPPGCGKSTFLNNLLLKFQQYANSRDGCRYEVVWRLGPRLLGARTTRRVMPVPVIEELLGPHKGKKSQDWSSLIDELSEEETLLVPCPSHDNPLLLIPPKHRRDFLGELFPDGEIKQRLLEEKQYDWVFRQSPCTICSSIYAALLGELKTPEKVLSALYARRYLFDRRLGQGITVFNPGDRPMKETVLSSTKLQERLEEVLPESTPVRYIYSTYAKTNDGVYALMDVKGHNTDRLIALHNIISEGVHKVEDIEENVNSLFVALMNPEDDENIAGIQSFSDRIEYIKIPYVLDLNTEVAIYRSTFGKHIERSFLPRVLHNFARVVISTRLTPTSEAMLEWIGSPDRYHRYCDKNLLLLKMEIYTGYIPPWLLDDDRKRFTAKRRRRVIGESESEGNNGFSGRDSIKIFNEFYSTFAREDRLINMAMVRKYFTEMRKDLAGEVPEGLLDSLIRMYNYTVLEEVKQSLFYFNEEQISRDIMSYLFAVNFEPGVVRECPYTKEKLEISDELFASIERRILGPEADDERRANFRAATQKTYAAKTLTQEMGLEGKKISETELYTSLRERYIHNLKDKVLDPFLDNDNFRRAIKDHGSEGFKTYDRRIRDDVTFLITNLVTKHGYTAQGAREVCIYVIDNNLAKEFA